VWIHSRRVRTFADYNGEKGLTYVRASGLAMVLATDLVLHALHHKHPERIVNRYPAYVLHKVPHVRIVVALVMARDWAFPQTKRCDELLHLVA
jgi:hypothetical protein